MSNYIYTWDKFLTDNKKMAAVVKAANYDMIIGVATGGLPFLTSLYNSTKIPYEIVKCSSYDGQTKKFFNMEFSIPFIGGKRILIIDDISDTGETLQKVVERCKEMGTEGMLIDTATLCVKPHTKFWPTWWFCLVDNQDWVYFPWESNG
jgi:hypoxanthine phosphoribosyltransferase